MYRHRKLLLTILLIAVLVGILAFPLSASAGRFKVERGFMFVPPNATTSYHLQVGKISVTIPPGALPRGGPVILTVISRRGGQFLADFRPDYQFAKPVLMDFGTAPVVYYWEHGQRVPIQTSDLDGDGEVGEILSDHFSRYSGWY
ncbi:MAG: hypothetical protein J7M05_07895 [Anaerolineae bacterium]|nr:hypothetical protein [Anaerolineae bacterium]